MSILALSTQPVQQSQAVVVRQSQPVVSSEKIAILGTPVYINVPAASVHVNILPGNYDQASNSWTLSGLNAHVATMMAPANNIGGNTFIYGHNNKDVFGPLKDLPDGATVEVITDNGNKFYYRYTGSSVVPPTDVSLFTYQGPPILTLQTCTGTWHEKRQILQFKLERVIESPRVTEKRLEEKRQSMLKSISAYSSNAPHHPILQTQ